MINANVNTTLSAGFTPSTIPTLTPRIIQYNGRRLCIRLEDPYWDILADMAQAKSLKLNELVHCLYLDPVAENNKTAFLRLEALNWLSNKVTEFEDRVSFDQSEAHAILKTADQPAIIFSCDQSISACNEKFRLWVSKNLSIKKHELDIEKVRISFRRAYKILIRKIDGNHGALNGEQVSILLPGYVLSTSVNLTSLASLSPDSRTFIGFFK